VSFLFKCSDRLLCIPLTNRNQWEKKMGSPHPGTKQLSDVAKRDNIICENFDNKWKVVMETGCLRQIELLSSDRYSKVVY